MSRIKTHSGAKKRFKVTKSGKVKHKKAYTSHLLTNKSKANRRFRYGKSLGEAEEKKIKALLN